MWFCLIHCVSFYVHFALGNIKLDSNDVVSVNDDVSKRRFFRPLQFHDENFNDVKPGISTATEKATGLHYEKAYFALEIDRTLYNIELTLNTELLPSGFTIGSYNDSDVLKMRRPNLQERNHCYYQGSVQGINNSLVVMSTCYGLSGTLFLDNHTWMIEPAEKSKSTTQKEGTHVAYRADGREFPGSCGHSHTNEEFISFKRKLQGLVGAGKNGNAKARSRSKRNTQGEPQFVELMIVADNAMTKGYDSNALDHTIKEIANYLDAYYSQLGIRVVLSHIEKWSTSDKIPYKTKAQEVLNEFASYRQMRLSTDRNDSPWVYVDNVQLLYGGDFDGSTIGMATVGTMCSVRSAGVTQAKTSTQSMAATVAHEMGHNFGMNHDIADCSCPPNADCLMAPTIGSRSSKAWSACSKTYLQQSLKLGLGNCLLNVPPPDRLYGGPECGNNIVETGEECDCGLPEDCQSTCCNATSCKLLPGAQCDSGLCCSNCQFKIAGSMCRSTQGNECDLPEYCTGQSSNCPGNVYMENGWACANNTAMCAEGVCLTHDLQCENAWGDGAVSGINLCYIAVNRRGDRNGNCGRDDRGSFTRCTKGNATCGKLQCSGGSKYPIVNRNYEAFKNRVFPGGVEHECKATSSDATAIDVSDPGLVKDGTKCGEARVCSNGACVEMTPLNCSEKCNGNGVCNNLKHCHCNPGYAPPDCNTKGNGGSDDSGPPPESPDSWPTTVAATDSSVNDTTYNATATPKAQPFSTTNGATSLAINLIVFETAVTIMFLAALLPFDVLFT